MRAPHALPLLMPLLACGPASSHEDVSHPSQPLVFDEQQPSHPSLVVRVADLPALRAKASRSPWREVAQSALNYARNESFDPLASDFDAKTKMTDLCGALALAYVLDPRPLWVGKFRDTLAHWPAFYLASGDGVPRSRPASAKSSTSGTTIIGCRFDMATSPPSPT